MYNLFTLLLPKGLIITLQAENVYEVTVVVLNIKVICIRYPVLVIFLKFGQLQWTTTKTDRCFLGFVTVINTIFFKKGYGNIVFTTWNYIPFFERQTSSKILHVRLSENVIFSNVSTQYHGRIYKEVITATESNYVCVC